MALGSLIIQQKKQLSDRGLIKELTENPYLQFFIGLPAFQAKKPFDSSTLASFRKRLDASFLAEINELLLTAILTETDEALPIKNEIENVGTEILDATCASANFRYPQDTSLLNEARNKLEDMIDWFYKSYDFESKPRT